jgi:Na+/H+ antiporter NhaD/arsenite permease-like protein
LSASRTIRAGLRRRRATTQAPLPEGVPVDFLFFFLGLAATIGALYHIKKHS